MFRRFSFFSLILFAILVVGFAAFQKFSSPPNALAQSCGFVPVDVVLILDKSLSMTEGNPSKLTQARNAATRFVNILENRSNTTDSHVGVVSYSTGASIDSALSPGSPRYQPARNAISNITAGGDTCIECGIWRANQTINQGGRTDAKKIVILLTDGQANVTRDSQPAQETNLARARQAAYDEAVRGHDRRETIFFTIGLGNDLTGADKTFLRRIANIDPAGGFYDSPDPSQLRGIYEDIADKIAALGSINGVVFDDDGDGVYEPGVDEGLSGWEVILIPINPDGTDGTPTRTVTTGGSGTFSFGGICPGRYRLKQVVESGYEQLRPFDPDGYLINVENGALNYNFANRLLGQPPSPDPWIQSLGGDVRVDQTASKPFSNIIPNGEFLSDNRLPLLRHGLVFLYPPYNLGSTPQNRKANPSFWLIHGTKFKPGVLKTSYNQMVRTLTRGGVYRSRIQLFGGASSPCGSLPPNCDLKTPLSRGVYVSEENNVTIDVNPASPTTSRYDFEVGHNYIFLIKNNLNIRDNIFVPRGSWVIFIVGGNINVSENVTTLEGIYSADNNFSLVSDPSSEDRQLIINGSVITNALRDSTPGNLVGVRNLGVLNGTTPGVQAVMRPDFILNAPALIRSATITRQEVAPGE